MPVSHPTDRSPPQLQGEEWRDIEGFPKHQVSNLGRVRRQFGGYPLCHGGYRPAYWKLLKPSAGDGRYLRATLRRGAKSYTRYVHRLVARAFIGSAPKGAEVNHMDTDKQNNKAENLEYTTRQGNAAHAAAHHLFRHGTGHYKARFTDDNIREMRKLWGEGASSDEIAARFKTHRATVIGICKRKRWKHVD